MPIEDLGRQPAPDELEDKTDRASNFIELHPVLAVAFPHSSLTCVDRPLTERAQIVYLAEDFRIVPAVAGR